MDVQKIDKTNGTEKEDPLRYAFVEMLFALAVSQVAIHTADVLSTPDEFLQLLPVASHLLLSLLVIGASWIGWRQSQSPGMKEQIQSIFSLRAVGLLLDVFLVILYFVLVRSVELQQVAGATRAAASSAIPEAKWIAWVFVIYIFWDLLADVFSEGCLTEQRLHHIIFQGIRVSIASAAASAFCLFMAVLVCFHAESVVTPIQVILLDGALIAIVFLFRVLKVFEIPLAKLLRVQDCKAFAAPRPDRNVALFLTFILMLAWGVLICLALYGSMMWS